jgi:WD40 repeat protein
VSFSADSRWLVTASGNATIRLWDLAKDKPEATPMILRGHEGNILTVGLSPDNHWLVTGSEDTTARLWDLMADDPAATSIVLRGHKGAINTVAISPDSRWLVTGSEDGTARLWMLQLDELIENACRTAGRNLSYGEWEKYFPGEEYRQTCSNLPVHWSVKENDKE